MSERFNHHNLDAFQVARQALVEGEALAVKLPRGYATLADRNPARAAARVPRRKCNASRSIARAMTRQARFRAALGEASEAAAGLEAVIALRLLPEPRVTPVIALLGRLCAMLSRLSGPRR